VTGFTCRAAITTAINISSAIRGVLVKMTRSLQFVLLLLVFLSSRWPFDGRRAVLPRVADGDGGGERQKSARRKQGKELRRGVK